MDRPSSPDWNPYAAGVILGVLLLATFLIMGRGLGASGAIAACADACMPNRGSGTHASSPLLHQWLVVEVIGVAVGGLLAGWSGRRMRCVVERGPRISRRMRLAGAFTGGVVMATGAHWAGGCTSGQGLTGGALLNVGSWMMIGATFAGAYGAAWFVRKQWC